jgi:hypothetical protein
VFGEVAQVLVRRHDEDRISGVVDVRLTDGANPVTVGERRWGSCATTGAPS